MRVKRREARQKKESPCYLWDAKKEFIRQAYKLDLWIAKRGTIAGKPWWYR